MIESKAIVSKVGLIEQCHNEPAGLFPKAINLIVNTSIVLLQTQGDNR